MNLALHCLFCLVGVTAIAAEDISRNLKKGIAAHKVHSCDALQPHQTPSWWYSWGLDDGFGFNAQHPKHRGSFCSKEDSMEAVTKAREAGMDFVPMLYDSIPDRPLDHHVQHNLEHAQYLLTLNEPEFDGQAGISPADAAKMWPGVVQLALEYNLEIVGPCSEMGGFGMGWWSEWTNECNKLHGSDCDYDYICLHMYFQPYPCAAGVTWACIGQDAVAAKNILQSWHDGFGQKKIWITEFACAPWGGAPCNKDRHSQTMKQLGTVFEESDLVHRYSWYELYNTNWEGNSLNEPVWEGVDGMGCLNRKWLAAWGSKKKHIQTWDQCVSKALENEECHQPLSISMDDDACYCAKDQCDEIKKTWSSMTTFKHLNVSDHGSNLTDVGIEYDIIGLKDGETNEYEVLEIPLMTGSWRKLLQRFHSFSTMVH